MVRVTAELGLTMPIRTRRHDGSGHLSRCYYFIIVAVWGIAGHTHAPIVDAAFNDKLLYYSIIVE